MFAKYYDKLCDIPKNLEDKFTVCYMGETITYIVFDSVKSFVKLYKNTPNKHFYEIIRNDFRKFIVDIDQKISNNDLLDIIDRIKSVTKSDVCLFSSCNHSKTSYHMVAYEKYYTVDQCKSIIDIVDVKKICDRNVYKSVQLFRIEGSSKYKETRYKYLYGENSISDYIELFLAYCPQFKKVKKYNNIGNCKLIPDYMHYTIGKRVNNNLVHLKRVSPGYCNICKRIHHKENAYIVYQDNAWKFYCFRFEK